MAGKLPSFDFISDDALRTSLERDAVEMAACLSASAYKAVHVLAGSIVEAVLVDHLESSVPKPQKGRAFREMSLGELIVAARASGAVSDLAVSLAAAVQTYRNLIHPGRLTRLKESVDADTAAIVVALVGVISGQVSALREAQYGYTAQQLGTKVESDPSSLTILADLVSSSEPREIEKLLTEVIPTAYVQLDTSDYYDEDTGPLLTRLRRAFRIAFDATTDQVRVRVTRDYARVLREGSYAQVRVHETAFFRATDMNWMDAGDVALVKKHLLGEGQFTVRDELVPTLEGIGAFLDEGELRNLIGAVVRWGRELDEDDRHQVSTMLSHIHRDADIAGNSEAAKGFLKALTSIEFKTPPGYSKWLADEVEYILDPLPF